MTRLFGNYSLVLKIETFPSHRGQSVNRTACITQWINNVAFINQKLLISICNANYFFLQIKRNVWYKNRGRTPISSQVLREDRSFLDFHYLHNSPGLCPVSNPPVILTCAAAWCWNSRSRDQLVLYASWVRQTAENCCNARLNWKPCITQKAKNKYCQYS
jgi:hypothetical protein